MDAHTSGLVWLDAKLVRVCVGDEYIEAQIDPIACKL